MTSTTYLASTAMNRWHNDYILDQERKQIDLSPSARADATHSKLAKSDLDESHSPARTLQSVDDLSLNFNQMHDLRDRYRRTVEHERNSRRREYVVGTSPVGILAEVVWIQTHFEGQTTGRVGVTLR